MAGSNLTLQNLTLYYGGGGGTGADPEAALQLGDAATLTNVNFQACYRICVRGTNSEATYTFEKVLFFFGLGAYYTPAAIWAEAGTYNLTNTGFRNFRNGGESLIRVDSGARVTLNGCLYIFAVLPKLKSGNGRLTNNSSGNCVGTTIGNNYAVDDIPDEETVEEDCGLYEGWPVMSVSKTVTRNVVLTGDCDIRRGPTGVPHNLNLRVSSPAGERYTIRCNIDNDCFTVGGRLTLRNVNLETRNHATDPVPQAIRAIEGLHAKAISLTDVTIRPEISLPDDGTQGYRTGLLLVNAGATTLTRVTIQDHLNTATSTQASAVTVVGANNVRITDSIFSNNRGGSGAIRAFHENSRIRMYGTNTFTSNTPANIVDPNNVVTGCLGCPPNPVVVESGRSSTVDEDEAEPTPVAIAKPVHTCPSLPANIVVTATFGLSSGIQCRQIEPWLTGLPGTRDAVDLWAYVEQGATVCFQGSGRLFFLDAAYAPRLVSELPAYSQNGMTCAEINRPGTIALIPGPPAPANPAAPIATAAPAGNRSLQGCMVTTRDILRFRDAPGGAPLQYTDPWGRQENGWLPSTVTLTALERTTDWFKVDYYGTQGWVSADYVSPQGSCG